MRLSRGRMFRLGFAGGLMLGLGASTTSAQPFAGSPDKPTATPPKHRRWMVKSGVFAFALQFTPGVPNPGQMTEILLSVGEVPKTPDPRFGTHIPEKQASIIAALRSPDGASTVRYRVHELPGAAGQYGLHVTPKASGIYTLEFTGRTHDGRRLFATVQLPVGVWPLPPELEGQGAPIGGAARARRPIIRK